MYSEYQHRGYRVMTCVRKFQGDARALAFELEMVCGPSEAKVRPGRIELKGNHTRAIKLYLEKLGF